MGNLAAAAGMVMAKGGSIGGGARDPVAASVRKSFKALSCSVEAILFATKRRTDAGAPHAHVLASLLACSWLSLTTRPGRSARHVGMPIDSAAARFPTCRMSSLYDRSMTVG